MPIQCATAQFRQTNGQILILQPSNANDPFALPAANPEAYHCDVAQLFSHLAQWRDDYPGGRPFPHVVVDDFLRPQALRAVIASFPALAAPIWKYKHVETSRKHHCSTEDLMPVVIRDVLRELNSQRMILWLEELTGIRGLLPDPLLFGGGIFAIERGGYLKVHVDFNLHPHTGLERRLNLLLYLNDDWREDYGGHLELWEKGAAAPAKRVLPIANRCVVFSTGEHSYHGHPAPLTCPLGRLRICLSVYFYTSGRPPGEQAPAHSTLYIRTPG